MKNIENPICPNSECDGEEILWEEVIDSWYDADGVYLRVKGVCLVCNTEYEWTEHYEFHHYDNLEKRGKKNES